MKKLSLYAGLSHKRQKPFVATTSQGANIAGKTVLIADFTKLNKSQLKCALARFNYFTKRLENLLASKK